MVKLIPTAEVGFLGMARNEETLEPTTYAERLPNDLSDRQCFVLDPMLATGGSLILTPVVVVTGVWLSIGLTRTLRVAS